MANLAGAEQVRTAAGLVRRGEVYNLDYPLDAFSPSPAPPRQPPMHRIVAKHRDQRDDYLDGFWPQASSQVDGLRHRRHAEHGFYNGVPDSAVSVGSATLGVQRWAERPIVGRGILLDVARHREWCGRPIDHDGGEALPVSLLDQTADAQGVSLHPGDLLLLRTGWAGWYLRASEQDRAGCRDGARRTGMSQSRELLAWFYDNKVALAASDTFALEVLPAVAGSPFGADTDNGMLHQDLIALLGLPIGELWHLDELAADSAEDHQYESLVVVKPLHLVGGVGSPANATAIK